MASIKMLLALMAITSMFGIAIGANYTVGQPGGSWDPNTDLTKWTSDKTFHVGDNLLFSYSTVHDVWEVTAGDYANCAKGSPLMKYSGGNTLIPLTEIGFRYFICSVATHCVSGQKLAISVVLSDPSNSPPSPSVTSSPPPPPSPTGVAPAMNVRTYALVVVALVAMLLVEV